MLNACRIFNAILNLQADFWGMSSAPLSPYLPLGGWQTFVLAGRVYPPPPCYFFAPPLHSLHNYAKICCATQYFFCFLVLSPLSSPTQPVLLAFWTGTATGIFRLPPAPPSPPLPHLFVHVFLWPGASYPSSSSRAHLFSRIIFSALLHFSGPEPDATRRRRRRLLFGHFMHERRRLMALACFRLVLSSFNLISFQAMPLLLPLLRPTD